MFDANRQRELKTFRSINNMSLQTVTHFEHASSHGTDFGFVADFVVCREAIFLWIRVFLEYFQNGSSQFCLVAVAFSQVHRLMPRDRTVKANY